MPPASDTASPSSPRDEQSGPTIPGVHRGQQTPDAVAPPPGNPRFPYLDGLRAVAAGFVLVFHVVTYAQHRNSAVLQDLALQGIAIFFVLSGFLLYRPFIRSRLTGNDVPSVRAYARRRVLRIVPAYWVALTFALLVAGATVGSALHLPIYYLLLQDYFDATRFNGLPVAWTLSIEATYYALLPLLAYAAVCIASVAGRRRWRMLPESLIIAGFVALTLAVFLLRPTAPPLIYDYTDWFAGGMFLAALTFLSVRGRDASNQRRLPSSLAVVLWLVAIGLFVTETRLRYGSYGAHLLLLISALAIVTPAVFPSPSGFVSGVLRSPVLIWLGLVSYGIYLWHVPLMDVIDSIHTFTVIPLLLLTSVATIGVAAASYYLLEAPILRFKNRRS